MGLDLVEMVMELEDAFELRIPGSEAAQMRTVGEVSDYLWTRLAPGPSDECPAAHAFYAVRRALVEVTGAERRSIRPRTPVEALFPIGGRVRRWAELRKRFPDVPPLRVSPRMDSIYGRVVMAGAALGFVAGLVGVHAGAMANLLGGIVGAIVGGFAAHAFVSPFTIVRATRIPEVCGTVGALAVHVAATSDGRILTRGLLEHRVRLIVSETLDVPLAEVRRESRFVEDLGAG